MSEATDSFCLCPYHQGELHYTVGLPVEQRIFFRRGHQPSPWTAQIDHSALMRIEWLPTPQRAPGFRKLENIE